jgi:hypothetical protein
LSRVSSFRFLSQYYRELSVFDFNHKIHVTIRDTDQLI